MLRVRLALFDAARAEARRLLWLDCWAGGDGALVRYYECAGFTPTEPIMVAGWPGQILSRGA